ncbi:MAG: hypothetical protein ABSB19_12085 [Methylomonas sp.]
MIAWRAALSKALHNQEQAGLPGTSPRISVQALPPHKQHPCLPGPLKQTGIGIKSREK